MSAALRFKQAISRQLSKWVALEESQILPLLRIPKKPHEGHYSLSLARLSNRLDMSGGPDALQALSKEIAQKIQSDSLVSHVSSKGPNLHFYLQQTEFVKQVLQQVYSDGQRYGWSHVKLHEQQPTVVIDYSSPNIAKPFHAGHLRSTILGNFIKRIHQVMGYRVVGINYLGDWGKQYGMLAIGFERYGNLEKLKDDPIHHLYEVYVKINQDAKQDPTITTLAAQYFARMEQGDQEALQQWKTFRDMSISSYATIYERLGVNFEVYSGESQVESYIPKVHQLLQEKNLVTYAQDGSQSIDLSSYDLGSAVVRRSDGTSLYMTRDLASLLMRKNQFNFDKAIYVVGVEQEQYFRQLFKAAELMMGETGQLQHVSFGRINGMSTRQGTAVFLQDILDMAKSKILDYMQNVKQTFHDDETADQLGVSAILVQDMKSKRNKNYSFAWDRMTDARGDTGVFLQYAHARACGIERKAETPVSVDCNYALLQEPEAIHLLQMISEFPELVDAAFESLEPCTIVNYLFKLSHATSAASSALRVKDSEQELAKARMLLFWAARTTLFNGMSLIGLKPLQRM